MPGRKGGERRAPFQPAPITAPMAAIRPRLDDGEFVLLGLRIDPAVSGNAS